MLDFEVFCLVLVGALMSLASARNFFWTSSTILTPYLIVVLVIIWVLLLVLLCLCFVLGCGGVVLFSLWHVFVL